MSRPYVKFTDAVGGLGRLPSRDDHISAIFIDTTSPGAWTDTLGKKYTSLALAEADGITEGDGTYGLLWYYIKEFFRIAGAAELWVINSSDAGFTAPAFQELTDGNVRQIFWAANAPAYAGLAAHVATIKSFSDELETRHAYAVFITHVDDDTQAVDASLPDLRALTANTVSVVISGDGSGTGAELAGSLGVDYVSAGANLLGQLAKSRVNHSPAWVAQGNLSDGYEFEKILFSDGVGIAAKTDAVLDDLQTKGYIFAQRFPSYPGSYFNDSHSAIAATSDFFSIENNRTFQKAKRLVRAALLPELNSPLLLEDDGKMRNATIKRFELICRDELDSMQGDSEISASDVSIDPEQNVLQTDTINIKIRIVPTGTARFIEVNIGFAVSV